MAVRILGISGSLRKASTNTGLLRAAAKNINSEEATFKIANLTKIPVFNEDIEPEINKNTDTVESKAINRFIKDIQESDAILFASPEYNYGISGALKNAIDWASRKGAFSDKTGAIIGAGGFNGTVLSHINLRNVGFFLNIHFINKPELKIRRFEDMSIFDKNGDLQNEKLQTQLDQVVQSLIEYTNRLNNNKDD
eukprot:TRINITY_DN1836_c0_g1_i1.p1 TRINITY_DN1836_c0_g1~~TRINITY_DN1836_c0_g1_i1.p1  ORF type:complete len:195 (+),score=58.45 TRINITY_DN1836_c0_g1_i1:73-657(+)